MIVCFLLCGPCVIDCLVVLHSCCHYTPPPAPSQPSLQVCKVWPIKGGLLVERKVTSGVQSSDPSQE